MKPAFISRSRGWRAIAFFLGGAVFISNYSFAQDSNRSHLFGDTNNAALPLGGDAQISENMRAYIGVNANVVGTFQNRDADDEDAVRSEVYVTIGVDLMRKDNGENLQVLKGVNLELGTSFQDIMSQATDSDYQDAGNTTYSTGLTNVQARDVINKLRLLAALLSVRGMGNTEITVLGQIGKYKVDNIGSFIPNELLATESVLTPYSLEQQDAVGVSALIDWNKDSEYGSTTQIDVNFHGNDWTGYTIDALKDVKQDGEGSYAINLLHAITQEGSKLQFKISVIENKDGVYYTRALASEQPGENTTYAAGIRWDKQIHDLGTLILSAEGAYIDRADKDALTMVEGFAGMEFKNLPFTPFVDVAFIDDAEADTQDWALTVGAALRVISGMSLSAGVQFFDHDSGDSEDPRLFVAASFSKEEPVKTAVMGE